MNKKKQLVAQIQKEYSPPFKEKYEIWLTNEKNGEIIETITIEDYVEKIIELRKRVVSDPDLDYMFALEQLKQVDNWYEQKTRPPRQRGEVDEEQTKAEIADEYAQRILGQFPIKTMEDTQEIFYWKEETGLYEPAQRMLENLAQHELKVEATNHLIQEIMGRVKRLTYIKRSEYQQKNLIPLANGVYNIKTSQMENYTPKHFFTTKHPIHYDPMALCPTINKFLFEVCENDIEKVWMLEKIAAYCFYRDLPIQNCFMLHGKGRNGKSVYLNLVGKMLGEENTTSIPLQMLSNDRFSAAELYNKNANIYNDLSSSELKETSLFKSITGDDAITVQKKYLNPFKFKNYAKLLFACNQIPEAKDDTDGYHRRWIIIGFNYQIPQEMVNYNLLNELTTREEMSGWLNVLLNRLEELLREGKFDDETIEEKRKKYTQNSNSTHSFNQEYLDYDPQASVNKKEIYEKYYEYCKKNHLPNRTEEHFWRTMREIYGEKMSESRPRDPITGNRRQVIHGLALNNNQNETETTITEEQREKIQKNKATIAFKQAICWKIQDCKEKTGGNSPKEWLIETINEKFVSKTKQEIEETISELKKDGILYEPRSNELAIDRQRKISILGTENVNKQEKE